MRFLLWSAAPLALAFAAGCTPQTQYRYTGFVPAAHAMAWDGRTAKDGTIRVEGSMVQSTVVRNEAPQPHDTALRVPNVTVEGAAFLSVLYGFEIGVRYAYAAYAWGEPSATGTMPLPSRPSLWGLGPEMHATIPFDNRRKFTLGIGASWMRYETPYGEWERTNACNVALATCFYDVYAGANGTYYRNVNDKSESHMTLAVAVYPSIQIGDTDEWGHVFGGFTMHTGYKNDGFTDTASSGSTIQDAGLVTVFGAGYGIKLDPVRLAAMVSLPVTSDSSPIHYGLGGFFTLGLDMELWESREDRKRRQQQDDDAQRRAAPPPPVTVIPGGGAQ